MSTTMFSYNVRLGTQDPEPNPTGTDFEFFDIELNFMRLLGGEHVSEVLEQLRLTTRCPRQLLLSEDEGLNFLCDFLSSASEHEEFVAAVMADTLSTARMMDIDPNNQGREAVQLILDLKATSYEEHFPAELERVILESERETETRFERASESSIKSLKRVRVNENGTVLDDNLPNKKRPRTETLVMKNKNCSVCLEDFGGGDEIVEMPCCHVFHGDCIVRWLETSHFCPLCRYPMPVQID